MRTIDVKRTSPAGLRLRAWHLHCEQEHGASSADYRSRVVDWHGQHHPECGWTPPLRRWTRVEINEWLFNGGATPASVLADVPPGLFDGDKVTSRGPTP